MRNSQALVIFIFLINFSVFGQKVKITPTLVNGKSVISGPINLASTPNSSVSLTVTVEMPEIPRNTGTLKIYSINGLYINTLAGGDGGALFFGEGKTASRSFVITLDWGSFATSGSYIYAEYKKSNNIVYRSAYIAIIKDPKIEGGVIQQPADAPDPSKIVNTLCCNQIVRLGDKPQSIVGSSYLNPYKNFTYGINSSWGANGNVEFLTVDGNTLNIDYINELGDFTVTRSLGYNNSTNLTNRSNSVLIKVVTSPILTNDIFTNGNTPNANGFFELSSIKALNLNGFDSKVNLNILQDPAHVSKRGDVITDVESYRWEYREENTKNFWTTIPNETSSAINFSNPSEPSDLNDKSYSIRRIAIYKSVSRTSNIIKVLFRGLRNNNTICCDQTLKITSLTEIENPNIIVGSTPEYSNLNQNSYSSILYQWQNQKINRGTSDWSNIIGATSKNYQPSPLIIANSSRQGLQVESTYNFRRIAIINYTSSINGAIFSSSETSYSNEINLSAHTSRNTPLKIYPNPAISLLNIESTTNLLNAQIYVTNIMGKIVASNNFKSADPKLLTLDVSNLLLGTYFITIISGSGDHTQLTFVKN